MAGKNYSNVLDALAKNAGKPLSIRGLAEEMSSKNKRAHYPNVYQDVKDLTKKGVLKLTRVGHSRMVELDFSSNGLQPALTEMELLKANNLFENQQLSSMRKGLDLLFFETPHIGAACVISDRKLFALKKIELLVILRPPEGEHKNKKEIREELEDCRTVIAERVNALAANTNTAIDFLALSTGEFTDAVFSKELNPVKNLVKKAVAVYNPGFYWMVIAAGRQKGMEFTFQEQTADPRALSREDAILAFGRHGYRETGIASILSPNYSIETAIAAALVLGDARLLEAIPVILAKDKKQGINYALLEYLARKNGKLDLLGFLLETAIGLSATLKENVKAKKCLERIKATPAPGSSNWQIRPDIRKEDIRDKMRLYHAD